MNTNNTNRQTPEIPDSGSRRWRRQSGGERGEKPSFLSTDVIRVIHLDDHPLIREGIRRALSQQPWIELCGEGWAGEHLEPLVRAERPHVVLLDLLMPEKAGDDASTTAPKFRPLPAIRQVHKRFPSTEFLVLSQLCYPGMALALAEIGVRGFLLKEEARAANLIAAISAVHRGEVCLSPCFAAGFRDRRYWLPVEPLSRRQLQVLQCLASHADERQRTLAVRLGIQEATLKRHLSEIRERLGVRTNMGAVIKGVQMGIISLEGIPYPQI